MIANGEMVNRLMGRLRDRLRRPLAGGLAAAVHCLQIPRRVRAASRGSISFAVHLVGILVLGFLVAWSEYREPPFTITVLPVEVTPRVEPILLDRLASPELSADWRRSTQQEVPQLAMMPAAPSIDSPFPGPFPHHTESIPAPVPRGLQPSDLLLSTGAPSGGGFEGRWQPARSELALRRGGTPASEDAVARGLAWLAAHQREDGSWRFDLRDSPCGGLCRDHGEIGSTTGATGLALLPFLGAGEIGESSNYKDVVNRGLYYLTAQVLLTPHGGDLQQGTMYAQGIATIALSEACAMTDDPTLRPAAQEAIRFIVNAQHAAGGWRYFPGQPGDTTVFGWQRMALKSAQLADLDVPTSVIHKAGKYLDSVQDAKGTTYGYLTPGRDPTPTAIGLLCRMYDGWRQDDARLANGISYLEKMGPSRTDVYFNYYATQVMHHYEGPGWDAWNRELRDRLVATQSNRGHESGSWHFRDEHGDAGGRLYTTAMCTMILEVYYRHMPLYERRAVEDAASSGTLHRSRLGERRIR